MSPRMNAAPLSGRQFTAFLCSVALYAVSASPAGAVTATIGAIGPSANPSPARVGESITATVSNVAASVPTEVGGQKLVTTSLTYSYDWGTFSDSTTSSASGSFASSGTKTISVTVTVGGTATYQYMDDGPQNVDMDVAGSRTFQVDVTVVSVVSVSSDIDEAAVGSDVVFTVTTHPTGYEDLVSWSGGGVPGTQSGGATFTTSWNASGNKTVTATCGTSNAGKTVAIVAVASVTSNVDHAGLGSNVIFTVTTNPTGHAGLVSWSGGGTPASQNGGATFTTNWSASGNKTVTATSGSSNGGKTVAIVSIASVTSDRDDVGIGSNVVFTVTTHPSGHENLVSWSGGGTPATQSGGSTFTTQWGTAGDKTVTASYGSSNAGKTVTVVGIASVTSDKNAAGVGSDIVFTVTTNPAGHEGLVSWSGGGTPDTQTGGATFTTQWGGAGSKTVTATCGTSNGNKDVTIVSIASVTSDKDDAEVNSNVVFTVTTNPTGHGSLVSWSGGETPATQSGGATFTTQWSTVGSKTVTATCGSSAAGKTVTIGNSVTDVVSVTADNSTVAAGSNVVFTVTTDPAGEENLVSWSGGGTPASQNGGATFTTQWSDPGSKTVTASSGTSSQTADVTVVGVQDVSADSSYILINSNVVFTVTTDPAGNESMVTWSGGGTPDTQTGGATFTTQWSSSGSKTVTATIGTSSATATVDVVDAEYVKVKQMDSSESLSTSTTIAAGGKSSAVHKAVVEMKITPVPSGTYSITVPVTLSNAEGDSSDNVQAKLYMNGDANPVVTGNGEGQVTISSADGKATGYLLSSNKKTGSSPCVVQASAKSSSVAFSWDTQQDDEGWEFAEFFVENRADPISLSIEVNGTPIDGHDIKFYVTQVTGYYSNGQSYVPFDYSLPTNLDSYSDFFNAADKSGDGQVQDGTIPGKYTAYQVIFGSEDFWVDEVYFWAEDQGVYE